MRLARFRISAGPLLAVLAACITMLAGPGSGGAELDPMDAPLERVQFSGSDTLRGLVAKYLHDPDLWPVVLALNNIASPADLLPGTELSLPVRQVMAADHALLAALQEIQKANAEGARIFAPTEIGQAIDNRDDAISRREQGEWRQVVNLAGVASDFAREALAISVAQRDRSAEAVVSDVQGQVEGRTPSEQSWSGRLLNDILVEFEKLRTLSNSTTQVTFRDLSRLRLNPNSNATIQRMRSDPLTGTEVTKVSLAEGDFYALLNQLSGKTEFEIEVPGIETTTSSADFWIKNDKSGARFVNYDAPGLQIARNGENLTVGQNEGVVLTTAGAQRAEVLPGPVLNAPAPGAILYTAEAPLSWAPLDAARGYWLEIAADPGFNEMQLSEWGIGEPSFTAIGLEPGRYHWRIAALDALGLPGAWSLPRDFTLRVDTTPPFLALMSPAADSLVTTPTVEVLGASEMEATVALNGAPLELGADGSFLSSLSLAPGPNRIEVAAVDPAGNRSQRSLTVTYRPAAEVRIVLAGSLPRVGTALATRTDMLTVTGTATAEEGAAIVVRDDSGTEVLRSQVGPAGALTFSVPAEEALRGYVIEVLAPGGTVEGQQEFSVIRDGTAPEIRLDMPPPRVTSDEVLQLSGSAGDAVRLDLNGAELPLADGRFTVTTELVPGENGLELVAQDAVGNVGVTRLSSFLDLDPPEVVRVDLGRQGANGPIELTVEARDASGLRQAAPFILAIDGEEVQGFLRCDSDTGLCRASLPPQPGALELIEVVIEDYAGNAAYE
ncbi:FecR domain-containing protein [Pseudodonghicola flavimaris]|uniref:FecR domain-containing protein n=1 Tax=Pseudodonghicola flavimaris TaxID=3050036 RepID=A0ABT7EXY6_9RHOB|nr:FecR domain-containing protein [Pseudodonghicola flavimaris]MDK3017194.1 FecR domain-containing protein [Pseudodonghicola flavimaris]